MRVSFSFLLVFLSLQFYVFSIKYTHTHIDNAVRRFEYIFVCIFVYTVLETRNTKHNPWTLRIANKHKIKPHKTNTMTWLPFFLCVPRHRKKKRDWFECLLTRNWFNVLTCSRVSRCSVFIVYWPDITKDLLAISFVYELVMTFLAAP